MTGAPRQVGIQEAKTDLSRLLRDVEEGAEIILTRDGRPVARITSVPEAGSVASSYGLFKDQFELSEDFDADSGQLADLFGVPR